MTSSATRSDSPGGTSGIQRVQEQPPASRSGLASLLALPAQATRSVVRSSGTTPGRLSIIAIGLVVLSLLAGLAGTLMVETKSDTMTGLTERTEPLAAAAQQVYRALSDADATAASAFLSTGEEPAALRERYENAIAQAGASLGKAASDPTADPRSVAQIDIIGQQLPVYTGLIETARTNNRQGFPVGASYLREASELMRSKILPAAEELYRTDTERLAEEQEDAGSFPWLTTLLVLAAIGALIAAQLYLRRRTNRLFNVGLVVATVAVLVGLLWTSVALIAQGVLINSGQRDGTEQVDLLVKARIAALKSRADETLTLVARGDGGAYEEEFVKLTGQFAGEDGSGGWLKQARDNAEGPPLADHLDDAMTSAESWLRAHAAVREQDDGGNYSQAVKIAIDGEEPEGSSAAFMQLDDDLRAAITAGRQSFFDDTTSASRALTLLAPGWAALGVVAAFGVAVGIRERLREYR
ncbi:MAG: hypothetical protein GEU86_11370 [Actinophytocola sp.]|nr:hypothetical protein [Actinophytocola sp.]